MQNDDGDCKAAQDQVDEELEEEIMVTDVQYYFSAAKAPQITQKCSTRGVRGTTCLGDVFDFPHCLKHAMGQNLPTYINYPPFKVLHHARKSEGRCNFRRLSRCGTERATLGIAACSSRK